MRGRLIVDPPRGPATNMAADEYLLTRKPFDAQGVCLRFYTWQSHACSIGYFQDVSTIAKILRKKNGHCPAIVRRLSGGGLVPHGLDLTFSITMSCDNPRLPRDVKESYLLINTAILKQLKAMHPQMDYADCSASANPRGDSNKRFCFEAHSCYDLLMGDIKILGSSQRRLRGVLLHQSSMFIKGEQMSEYIPMVAEAVGRAFDAQWTKEDFSSQQMDVISGIEAQRYRDEDWFCPGDAIL